MPRPLSRRAHPPVQLAFPGSGARLAIAAKGAEALAQGLGRILTGWVPERLGGPGSLPLLAAAAYRSGGKKDAGWLIRSRYFDRPTGGLPLASAVCALVADLSQAWAEAHPDGIGLHCGALAINGRLVLLTGPARAGKTSLTTRLACVEGVEFYCDDVLPLVQDPEQPGGHAGVSLGIAPRLRLPVLGGSETLERLTRSAKLLSDDRYAYVAPPCRASHGTRAPLAAIVLLDRRESGPAKLHQLAPDEVLALLLRQSITDHPSAEAAFERLRAIASGLICLRLVYSDLDEASALLHAGFSRTEGPSPASLGPALPPMTPEEGWEPASLDQVFARDPEVQLRRHGGAAFLWRPGETRLWQLNTVGHAIWALLEAPGHALDLAEVLAEAFPNIGSEQLAADTARLLGGLAAEGLIKPVPVRGLP